MNPPRCTHVPILNPLPPPSPYHPSGSSQCTSPKHPVSCIEPGLAICFIYDIIHVSVPFSQIIPPCPLPKSPKDCSIHLYLFCFLEYRVIITIFLNSIYMCYYTVLVFFFLAYFTLYIFPFLHCFSLFFFSQLFVRASQTAILLFCISFPWGWS